MELETEDIDLTPDMSKVWGGALRGLREAGETMLYSACLDVGSIEYTRDTIEITARDLTLYNLLTKHRAKLEQFVGVGCVNIHKKQPKIDDGRELVDALEKLFKKFTLAPTARMR